MADATKFNRVQAAIGNVDIARRYLLDTHPITKAEAVEIRKAMKALDKRVSEVTK